ARGASGKCDQGIESGSGVAAQHDSINPYSSTPRMRTPLSEMLPLQRRSLGPFLRVLGHLWERLRPEVASKEIASYGRTVCQERPPPPALWKPSPQYFKYLG